MKPWLRYTLLSLTWLGVVAYIIFATWAVRTRRASLLVERVNINVVDSSAVANLVTRSMVERWIKESKIKTIGQPIDSVQLVALESHIESSGFVDNIKCYTTYNGELNVEVTQLRPVIRILLDGYNSYITSDGYIFTRPPASSHYTPVVTGGYKPLFRAGYTGSIHDIYAAQREEIEAEVKRIEVKNIYPLYGMRVKIREELRVVNSRYTGRRFGEGRQTFDGRVAELKERNSSDRARLLRAQRENDAKIEKEKLKQKVYIDRQKKLEKKYKDFINLITFVNVVENDKFWSSEIVQIIAGESTSGDLRLELIPRSGNFTITLGELHDAEQRLMGAKTFYRRVLPVEGWQKFKNINVEYKNQVVCK